MSTITPGRMTAAHQGPLVVFVSGMRINHFHKVGKRLDSTVAAYNDAVGSLESRVLVSARRFSELGAASSQAIPELEVVDHRSRPLRAGDTSSESAKQDGGDSED